MEAEAASMKPSHTARSPRPVAVLLCLEADLTLYLTSQHDAFLPWRTL